MTFAQISASNGNDVLSVAIGVGAILGSLAIVVNLANGLKTLFQRKPSQHEDFERQNQRIDRIEGEVKSMELRLGDRITHEFQVLDGNRSRSIGGLHEQLKAAEIRVATLQETVIGTKQGVSLLTEKLDRWMEGELAQTRRDLSDARQRSAA